jgi:hypothetical protein
MQLHAEKLLDLSRESAATRRMYGLDTAVTANFGTSCLMARRLVEEGVRFVQVHVPILGNGMPWDQHNGLKDGLRKVCPHVDRPSAALICRSRSTATAGTTTAMPSPCCWPAAVSGPGTCMGRQEEEPGS